MSGSRIPITLSRPSFASPLRVSDRKRVRSAKVKYYCPDTQVLCQSSAMASTLHMSSSVGQAFSPRKKHSVIYPSRSVDGPTSIRWRLLRASRSRTMIYATRRRPVSLAIPGRVRGAVPLDNESLAVAKLGSVPVPIARARGSGPASASAQVSLQVPVWRVGGPAAPPRSHPS